jgi:hypothetical protein
MQAYHNHDNLLLLSVRIRVFKQSILSLGYPWQKTNLQKKLINPGSPAAHPEPAYRCFLPDLTGFTGPWLRRTRVYERKLSCIIGN